MSEFDGHRGEGFWWFAAAMLALAVGVLSLVFGLLGAVIVVLLVLILITQFERT